MKLHNILAGRAQVLAVRADERMWGGCGSPALAAGVRATLGALAGTDAALAAATEGWLELLVARLLHQAPAAPLLPDAHVRVAAAAAAKGGPGPGALLQAAAAVLVAAADRDAAAALAACCSVASSRLLAHAVDLLPSPNPNPVPGGKPGLPPALGTPDLGEWYRCEYAGALLAARATQPLAAEVGTLARLLFLVCYFISLFARSGGIKQEMPPWCVCIERTRPIVRITGCVTLSLCIGCRLVPTPRPILDGGVAGPHAAR